MEFIKEIMEKMTLPMHRPDENKIMDAIRGAVCGKKEFTVSNCSVHIYPSMFLLTNKFLSLTSRLNVVEVNTLGITLKFF